MSKYYVLSFDVMGKRWLKLHWHDEWDGEPTARRMLVHRRKYNASFVGNGVNAYVGTGGYGTVAPYLVNTLVISVKTGRLVARQTAKGYSDEEM